MLKREKHILTPSLIFGCFRHVILSVFWYEFLNTISYVYKNVARAGPSDAYLKFKQWERQGDSCVRTSMVYIYGLQTAMWDSFKSKIKCIVGTVREVTLNWLINLERTSLLYIESNSMVCLQIYFSLSVSLAFYRFE